MAAQTTVVVVNWNGEKFLPALLDSLDKAHPAEIIVVDNASSDASTELIKNRPAISSILNRENLGFGSAANQGIGRSKTPFVLVLNADVQVLTGAVERLESFLNEHSEVAVVAPQLLFPDGSIQPSCRTFPTIVKYSLFLSYLDRIIPAGYRYSRRKHNRMMEVDQPMGAALMFRKSTLEKTGVFDPQFFMYMEEIDLCQRIKEAGWKIVFLPDAKVIHHAGGSTNQDWKRSQRDYFNSVVLYFQKRLNRGRMFFMRVTHSLALFVRSLILVWIRPRQSWFYFQMAFRILTLQPLAKSRKTQRN